MIEGSETCGICSRKAQASTFQALIISLNQPPQATIITESELWIAASESIVTFAVRQLCSSMNLGATNMMPEATLKDQSLKGCYRIVIRMSTVEIWATDAVKSAIKCGASRTDWTCGCRRSGNPLSKQANGRDTRRCGSRPRHHRRTSIGNLTGVRKSRLCLLRSN